jgi:hypothetical protein
VGVASFKLTVQLCLCPGLQVWNWIMEPMLFATIGTSIVFSELPGNTIPLSLLVVCTGRVTWGKHTCVHLAAQTDRRLVHTCMAAQGRLLLFRPADATSRLC